MGIHDYQGAARSGTLERGGYDLGAQHSFAVVDQNHGIGRGRRGPCGLRDLVEGLACRRASDLAIRPQELLVVGHESRLDRGEPAGIGDQAIGDLGLPGQECPQFGGGRINPNQADHTALDPNSATFIVTFAAPPSIWYSPMTSRIGIGASGLIRSAFPWT